MDVTSPGWGAGSGLLEQAVDLTKPVAAPVDVDDVDVVEQAVEDRSREDLAANDEQAPCHRTGSWARSTRRPRSARPVARVRP